MCGWCETVFSWIWEEFWTSVWNWVKDSYRKCKRRKCKWICACCNKWWCYLKTFFVLVAALIASLILTLVALVVCAGCYVVCIVLCLLGILFGSSDVDACVEAWCQGRERESDEKPPVDPQKPPDPDGGGPLGTSGGTTPLGIRFTVESAAELREIGSRRTLFRRAHVVLRLPGLDPEAASHWEFAINRQLAACGCGEGAVFMLLGVLGYATILAGTQPVHSLLTWSTLGVAIIVAVGAGLIGKLIGLVRARLVLARLLLRLRELTTGEVRRPWR